MIPVAEQMGSKPKERPGGGGERHACQCRRRNRTHGRADHFYGERKHFQHGVNMKLYGPRALKITDQ